MDDVEWRDTIAFHRLSSKAPNILEVLYQHTTQCRPLHVLTEDFDEYVAKPLWNLPPPNRYQVTAEWVVGRLGKLMSAPVPAVQILRLRENLKLEYDNPDTGSTETHRFVVGFCYGSEFLPGLYDSYDVERLDLNRERFAQLVILYGWMEASDRQYSYEGKDRRVYSCDHGDFLSAKSPLSTWPEDADFESVPQADLRIVAAVSLTPDELASAARGLRRVTERDIIATIAMIPEEWGITIQEREHLRSYLVRRRHAILGMYP